MLRRMIGLLAAALLVSAGAFAAEEVEQPLFDFGDEAFLGEWRLNIHSDNPRGERGTGRIEVAPGRDGGQALRFVAEDSGRHNFISPEIPDAAPWRRSDFNGAVVWHKGDGSQAPVRLVLVVQTGLQPDGRPLHHTYSAPLDMGQREWTRTVIRSFYSRHGPPINFSQVKRIYIAGQGDYSMTLGYVGLVGRGRGVLLEDPGLPTVVVPELPSVPSLKGDLSDPVWQSAAVVEDFKVFGVETTPAQYPTRAFVGYRDGKLYIGARLRGEKPGEIPAVHTIRDTSVWQDSCLEFYLDPGDTNREGYQFVANAIGTMLDIADTKAWQAEWRVATQEDAEDGWSIEIECDLSSLGEAPKAGDAWGFNLKRHVANPERGFFEVSGWSQGTPTPVSGYGTLIFGPPSPAEAKVGAPELLERGPGAYVLDATVSNASPAPLTVALSARLADDEGRVTVRGEAHAAIPARESQALSIELPFEVAKSGRHLLTVQARDAEGLIISRTLYHLSLSEPVAFNFDEVAPWPEPQEWRPTGGYWTLPAGVSVSLRGEGDRFPAEHLSERLFVHFGERVGISAGGPGDIVLEYADGGMHREGFELAVSEEGASLRAVSGRGMYYAVRALLQNVLQSSLGQPEPRALRVEMRDWPHFEHRVHFHRMDSRYQVSLGVQPLKDYIYDQIAGGRYNLMILNLRGGMHYASRPEIAYGPSLTRAEVKEVIDFARKHYVDVAPGGNAPGHAGWLTRRHPQLREDGDLQTLCTRHPDAMPLLHDLYGELIDLFQPTEYFHLGGDEVRWKTETVPPEQRCQRCEGVPKRELLLEYWREIGEFVRSKGVRPIIWSDMLDEKWNGGPPHWTSNILPEIPKDFIVNSWSMRPVTNPASVYLEHGLTPWKVQTGFSAGKFNALGENMEGQEALGIAQFMSWPWSNFLHTRYERLTAYTTASVHSTASLCWKPETHKITYNRYVASRGRHWMKALRPSEWGVRGVTYAPVSIAPACNASTQDDGEGWLGLGPDRDLRNLPKPDVQVGPTTFRRPAGATDCVLLRAGEEAAPIPVERLARGFVFLHTAAATQEEIAELYQRFFRRNTSHYGMPIAYYLIRYADGRVISVPAKLGYNVHFWDCFHVARVMPGARSFWLGFTEGQRERDPNAPDAAVWTMEWKNPYPRTIVKDIVFVSADTEATAVLLGVSLVR